ncbi:hypothetical protein [Legionella sp. W05-934-2]|jgi:hypothetical protein|uniref:hypothetical protein n=1 Tax=Legionella sp. W05-934-2 TaxID=1198649 RepID=UPI003462AD02
MGLDLRKSPFKRNRNREKNVGDIFNKASTSLNSVMSFAVTLFFTPALMASSLFSHEIILMLANISLCLGNITNFGYRIYQNDVGKVEIIVTLLFLAAFIAGSYFLFPTIISTSTLLGALALTNQLSVGVNLFFLLRNKIIPPILGVFRNIAKNLGFEMRDQYYRYKPLDSEEDESVVNALFLKHFNHSLYEGAVEDDLKKLNQLLQILTEYINDYDENMFGDINYKKSVSAIEGHIAKLTLEGNADSSYGFIRQKMAYKQTKIKRLEKAKSELDKSENHDWQHFSKFFKGIYQSTYEQERDNYHQKASQLFDKEIERQQTKINRLSSCLP